MTYTNFQPASQCAFSATATAQTNMASQTVIQFDTEQFDKGADFDTGTYTFTAPVDGIYFFTAHLRLENIDTASTYASIRIQTSNRYYQELFDPSGLSVDQIYRTMKASAIEQMTAGQTANVTFWYIDGAQQVDHGGPTTSQFAGYLITPV